MPKSQPKKAVKKPAPKAKASNPAPKAIAKANSAKPAKAVAKANSAKPAKTVAKPNSAKPAKTVAKGKSAKPVKTVAKLAMVPLANTRPVPRPPVKLTPFLKMQKQRLMALRDTILDSMAGVAKDTLRSRPEGSEASAFGMHQADAGSDAYDKDFALSLLSQEQDALYEVEEALKRVDGGTYGVCEMSGKQIAHIRLEAMPFARFTVECQAELEKNKRFQRSRVPVTSLFGLTENEGESDGDSDEPEETPAKPTED